MKPIRFGIKQFALCESSKGYALKFITCCGKGTVPLKDGFSMTESICLHLLEDFKGMSHHLYTDNFYTSPHLFRQLAKDDIGACGTVKAGRHGMPKILHPSQLPLGKEEPLLFEKCDNMVSCA